MPKELRCPYCKLFTNTYRGSIPEELSDGKFVITCSNNNCGKKFGFVFVKGKYKENKLPCMNGGKHEFEQVGDTTMHKCIHCGMEIQINKK